jgi:hypothetical protein
MNLSHLYPAKPYPLNLLQQYRLRVAWVDGRVDFTRSFAGRNCAECKAVSWREVCLVSRVEVVPYSED